MSRALKAITEMPWAIREAELRQIIAIATRCHEKPELLHRRTGEFVQGSRTERRDSTAIIPILGPIFPRANLFTDVSGAASLETLSQSLQEAIDDPEVESILLDIDSPGGAVAGVSDFVEMVAASPKKVVAYTAGDASSAAYWIASAADEIVMSPTASVGSVGAVITVRTSPDEEGSYEFVSEQSPMKRANPSTKEGQESFQRRANQIAQIFIEQVADNRGVSVETVLSDFGQGDTLVGADAVAAGMADRVGSAESVIAGLTGSAQEYTMTAKNEQPVITRDYIASEYPAIADAFRQEGETTARADSEAGISSAATAERERIQGVLDLAMPGHEDLINTLAFDGKTTPEVAAVKLIQAEKQAKGNALETMEKETEDAGAAKEPETVANSDAPIEERAKAQWDGSAELRAEFGNVFESFLAYSKANEDGRVRRLVKE